MAVCEISNSRRDLGPEPAAVEHTVVTDAGLEIVELLVRRKIAAQILCRLGLAQAGDVVFLAFNRKQRGLCYLARIDQLVAVRERPPGQRVFDVTHEGILLLDDFDPFVAAGGQGIAHWETFDVVDFDGTVTLEFTASVGEAIVSALTVEGAQKIEAEFYIAFLEGDAPVPVATLKKVAESPALDLVEVSIARDLLAAGSARPTLPADVELN